MNDFYVFTVYFLHSEYKKFWTVSIEASSILEAIEDFTDNYKYDEIYGIMLAE